jgi:hypothetical protein
MTANIIVARQREVPGNGSQNGCVTAARAIANAVPGFQPVVLNRFYF